MSLPKTRVICSSKIKVVYHQDEQKMPTIDSIIQVTSELQQPQSKSNTERNDEESTQAKKAKFRQTAENTNTSYVQQINLTQFLPLIQMENPSTYVTLTDITQDNLVVEEVNVQDLLKAIIPENKVSNSEPSSSNSISTNELLGDDSKTDAATEDDSDESMHGSDHEFVDNINTMEQKLEVFVHYKCPQCGEYFKKYKKWLRHTQKVHKFGHTKYGVEGLNIVPVSNKNGKTTHKCSECNTEFKVNSYFTFLTHRFRHMRHSRYFLCKLCRTGFYYKGHIASHLSYEHTISLKNMVDEPNYKEHMRMRCPLCVEVPTNEKQLYHHLNWEHKYLNNVLLRFSPCRTSKTLIKCNVCNCKLFKENNKHLFLHMLSHEQINSYICGLCVNFSCNKSKNLIVHLKNVHFQSTKIKCIYCNHTFDTEGDCLKHYYSFHKIDKIGWDAIVHDERTY